MNQIQISFNRLTILIDNAKHGSVIIRARLKSDSYLNLHQTDANPITRIFVSYHIEQSDN